MSLTRAGDARAARTPWPAPGRAAYFAAEPRIGWLHELVRRAAAAGTPLAWSEVTGLVDTFVGPDRDAGLVTLQRPESEAAQRNLRSLEARNALMEELMSYDPAATFVPRTPPLPAGSARLAGTRSDWNRAVRPEWVG